MKKQEWINQVRMYLNEEYTQHLHKRSLKTEDVEVLKRYIKKAKSIWAAAVSEADQILHATEKKF